MATIEEGKRLTESSLWEMQWTAYQTFGPDAWASKGVPFYLTSNPLTAKQFSRVIQGYLADCLREGSASPVDPMEPLYIFDLGAGSGKLGFLVLKHLLEGIKGVLPDSLKICYVMTDIVESNIAFWKKHPLLQPFISSGNLDFACYQHAQKDPIVLLESGRTLSRDTVANPVALVCTYFFDTIPQDLFRAREGRLEEGRITLRVPGEIKRDAEGALDPSLIMQLEANYEYFPLPDNVDYYHGMAEANQILQEYRDTFEGVPFLFPIGSFASLDYFAALSGNRMLVLAGDQGVSTEQQVREWGEPRISKHSSFSMAVSYHALARYFSLKGGLGLLTGDPTPKFAVICGILGDRRSPAAEAAFRDTLDCFEPAEYLELTNLEETDLQKFSLERLLILVKLGNWDPINFHVFYPVIADKAKNAAAQEVLFLKKTIERVFENFYPVTPSEGDFVMNLGVLLFQLNETERALRYFERALSIKGEDKTILLNLSQTHRVLGNREQAVAYYFRANRLP